VRIGSRFRLNKFLGERITRMWSMGRRMLGIREGRHLLILWEIRIDGGRSMVVILCMMQIITRSSSKWRR